MEFNWLAQIAAAASTLVIGFLWYNPKTFGNAWMKSIGLTPEDAQAGAGNMTKIFALSFAYAFLASLIVAYFAVHGDAEYMTVKHGLYHGGQLGIATSLPIIGTNALYERRSFTYVAINAGFWIVCFATMGAILNVWR